MTTDAATELLDDLRDGIRDLIDSGRWAEYLDWTAQFHDYSARNRMLIWIQSRGQATHVAGYRAWQKMDRQVRKGETGIRILAPLMRTITEEDENGNEVKRKFCAGFRQTSVFDISQTDATSEDGEVPTLANVLTGEAPEHAAERLIAAINEHGFTVEFVRDDACPAANGATHWKDQRVTIAPDLDPAQQVKTLAHELAHVVLHNPEDEDRPEDRGLIEVEAESVSYIVARRLGIQPEGYSLGYITGWGNGPDALDALADVADRVVDAADSITDTLAKVDLAVAA